MARTKRSSHSNIIRPLCGLIYGEYLTLVLDVTKKSYGGWFRSTDLWVMSPSQFLFATPYVAPQRRTKYTFLENAHSILFQGAGPFSKFSHNNKRVPSLLYDAFHSRRHTRSHLNQRLSHMVYMIHTRSYLLVQEYSLLQQVLPF